MTVNDTVGVQQSNLLKWLNYQDLVEQISVKDGFENTVGARCSRRKQAFMSRTKHIKLLLTGEIMTKQFDWSGIRTHAPEEIGALIQRLRPLGHPVLNSSLSRSNLFIPEIIRVKKGIKASFFCIDLHTIYNHISDIRNILIRVPRTKTIVD